MKRQKDIIKTTIVCVLLLLVIIHVAIAAYQVNMKVTPDVFPADQSRNMTFLVNTTYDLYPDPLSLAYKVNNALVLTLFKPKSSRDNLNNSAHVHFSAPDEAGNGRIPVPGDQYHAVQLTVSRCVTQMSQIAVTVTHATPQHLFVTASDTIDIQDVIGSLSVSINEDVSIGCGDVITYTEIVPWMDIKCIYTGFFPNPVVSLTRNGSHISSSDSLLSSRNTRTCLFDGYVAVERVSTGSAQEQTISCTALGEQCVVQVIQTPVMLSPTSANFTLLSPIRGPGAQVSGQLVIPYPRERVQLRHCLYDDTVLSPVSVGDTHEWRQQQRYNLTFKEVSGGKLTCHAQELTTSNVLLILSEDVTFARPSDKVRPTEIVKLTEIGVPTNVIIGCTVAAIVVLLVMVFCLCCYCKRRKILREALIIVVGEDVSDGILRAKEESHRLLNSEDHLASMLKESYQKMTLCPLPWLEASENYEINDKFITLYVAQEPQGNATTDPSRKLEKIHMNDIFELNGISKKQATKHILLHGEAGSGKSTLASKIALDWATDNRQIKNLQNFDLTFLIKCYLILDGDTFYDYVKRVCLPTDTRWKGLENMVTSNSILIIIDGYDEKTSNNDFVLDVLQRKILRNSTVIVTSGFGATSQIWSCFDIRIKVQGFEPEDVESFVEQNANSNTIAAFNQMKASDDPLLKTLFIPLYLWFFVKLGVDYFHDTQTLTRTQFYSQIIVGIRGRLGYKLENVNQSVSSSVVDSAIRELSALAYLCMKNDTMMIPRAHQVPEVASKLGLLNTMSAIRGLEAQQYYMFTHKTIMEYLAAKHITRSAITEGVVSMLNDVPEIADEQRRQHSMLLVFVLGLMQENQNVVTPVVKRFLPKFHGNENRHLALSCLCEFSSSDQLSKDLWHHRAGSELTLDCDCSPYCIRGLHMYTQMVPLQRLELHQYYSSATATIHTRTCVIRDCTSSVLHACVVHLDKNHIVYLHLDKIELSTERTCLELVKGVSACKSLESLKLCNMTLASIGELDQFEGTQNTSKIRSKRCLIKNCDTSITVLFAYALSEQCVLSVMVSEMCMTAKESEDLFAMAKECRSIDQLILEQITLESQPYSSYDTFKAQINAVSAKLINCSYALLPIVSHAVQPQCSLTINISDVTLTSVQCRDFLQNVSKFSSIDELRVDDVDLEPGTARYNEENGIIYKLPAIQRLQVHRCSSLLASQLVSGAWSSVKELKLCEVDLSADDVYSIVYHVRQSASLSCLDLRWLPNGGICKLMKGLRGTNCVKNLVEVEMWCVTDQDCKEVGQFVVNCLSLKTFRWRNRRVSAIRSDDSLFSVSDIAISEMWYQIATEAPRLQTVVVQEFCNRHDPERPRSREDQVFLSVLNDALTRKQRVAIQWQELYLIDKDDKKQISDDVCREVRALLPSVQRVYSGRDNEVEGREMIVARVGW